MCYLLSTMRRYCLILLSFCLLLAGTSIATAGSYALKTGGAIDGVPLNFNEQGVNFQAPDGSVLPRQAYDNFSQDGLKQLLKDAAHDEDRNYLEPRIVDIAQEKIKQREITLNPVPRLERPTGGTGFFALFGTTFGWFFILCVCAASGFAGYEVSVYKNSPPIPSCLIGAVAPVIGPIILLSLKKGPSFAEIGPATTTTETTAIVEIAETVGSTGAPAAEGAQAAPASGGHTPAAAATTAAAQKLPEPVIYRRGEFSFNRRFFETKVPGFFRVVPSEKDKDLVLLVIATRGEFIGRRISRIGANDMDLETFKDSATANEMIPFAEIKEVQIRHKDLPGS